MYRLPLIPIDGSTGIELPVEIVRRHDLKAGEDLILFQPNADWTIASPGSELDQQLRAGLQVMSERRGVLKDLPDD